MEAILFGLVAGTVAFVLLWSSDRMKAINKDEMGAIEKRLSHLETQAANGFQATGQAIKNSAVMALELAKMIQRVQEEADEKYLRKTDIN